MKRWKRAAVIALAIILPLPALLLSGGLFWLVLGSRDPGAGHCAKILATGVFVLGRATRRNPVPNP